MQDQELVLSLASFLYGKKAQDIIVLKVSHHGVELRHAVADGGSGSEDHALAVGDLVDIPAFEQHIRGFLRVGSGKSRHVPHFCIEEKVFVMMRLVHIQAVYAELLKGDDIILAGAVLKLFEFCFQSALRAL